MRRVCEGSFHVPLPPARAAELFTPEGERAWAPGWEPDYPAGPGGPVFTTHAGTTVWVALGGLRYARVTPGVQAGTVEVRCEPAAGGTRARRHLRPHRAVGGRGPGRLRRRVRRADGRVGAPHRRGAVIADWQRATHRLLAAVDAELAGLGLGAAEVNALAALAERAAHRPRARRGDRPARRHAHRLLDRLERRGLVARRPNPRDRRSTLIEPTAAGRAHAER